MKSDVHLGRVVGMLDGSQGRGISRKGVHRERHHVLLNAHVLYVFLHSSWRTVNADCIRKRRVRGTWYLFLCLSCLAPGVLRR